MREYLGLPDDVLPNTHKQRTEQAGARMAFPDKGGRGRDNIILFKLYRKIFEGGVRSDDRAGYRTAGSDKQADAGPGAVPVRQGFGRGGPPQAQ